MRLGKKPKKSRAWKKAGDKVKPKHVSKESVVGQITSDLISSVYAPMLGDLAQETLERYADDMMQYEELLRAFENSVPDVAEAEIEGDGSIASSRGKPPVEPKAPLFNSQFRVREFSEIFAETSDHFFAKSGGWRVHANAAKFERMLDEKYGVFRPFMTNHPEVEQFIRSVQRKYAMGYFSPIRKGDPPIPRSTAIILLFLMQRGNVQWEILVLASLFFLVGLQPWALVAIVALVQGIVARRQNQPVGLMKRRIDAGKPYYHTTGDSETVAETATEEQEQQRKYDLLSRPVGSPLKENETIDTSLYDTIVLGCGAGCLYAAALLSRAGRRVLVLCQEDDASDCTTLPLENPANAKFKNVPFDLGSSNMSKISRQQKLLAPALCTDTDYQGGVRFAQIGSKADGYAFEILSVPGVGTDRPDQQIPFVIKAAGGVRSLMEDAAMMLGDGYPDSDGSVGHSTTGAYVAMCEQMNRTAGEYYLSKVLPESAEKIRSTSIYQTASSRYAEGLINQSFPLNAHTRSLLAAIGLKGESLRPSKASMAVHITNVCAAMTGEGMHYPVGGPRALCHALAATIEQSGGRIVTKAPISELLFEEDEKAKASEITVNEKDSKLTPPTCVGVKLGPDQEVRFPTERFSVKAAERPVIVSMLTFITTFIRTFPPDIRIKYGCPRGLGALSEQRPVFQFLFALDGSASDLSLTGADYYRVPSAALALDEFDPTTNTVKNGEIGWVDQDEKTVSIDSGSAAALDSETVDEQKQKTSHQKTFEPGVSWIHISFPSAKDPSFAARHGNVTTCVVTIEADDDVVIDMGSKPRVFMTKKTTSGLVESVKRLKERVQRDVVDIYPQLEGKILSSGVVGPRLRGMSHTPERFVAKGVRTNTPYNNLFYGGSDLTIGESFSAAMVAAWLVSNAVVGYTTVDHLFLQKNITADLGRFLAASGVDEEDVAVPYLVHETIGNEEEKDS